MFWYLMLFWAILIRCWHHQIQEFIPAQPKYLCICIVPFVVQEYNYTLLIIMFWNLSVDDHVIVSTDEHIFHEWYIDYKQIWMVEKIQAIMYTFLVISLTNLVHEPNAKVLLGSLVV